MNYLFLRVAISMITCRTFGKILKKYMKYIIHNIKQIKIVLKKQQIVRYFLIQKAKI